MKITRRALFQLVGGTSAVAILGGCSGGSSTPEVDAPPANCSVGDASCTIKDNHVHSPHVLEVTSAEIAAGVDKVYDIMGAATHNHQVTVTAADFATLAGGGTVMIQSTVEICHSHLCTISCA